MCACKTILKQPSHVINMVSCRNHPLLSYLSPGISKIFLGQVRLLQAKVKEKSNRKVHKTTKFTCQQAFPDEDVIIEARRLELNHYKGQMYNKFEPIPLVSRGWKSKTSKGDYFIIKPYAVNPAILEKDMSFEDLGINGDLVSLLEKQSITTPTKIQAAAIPKILAGRNSVIAAETGCGKTLAYLLPLIQQIISLQHLVDESVFNSPLGLVICPSRELAEQIEVVAYKLTKDLPITTRLLIGGRTKRLMMNPKFEKIDLLISTIGALSKLTTTGIYRLGYVSHLVLDEADTLLDDSFNEKLVHFLKKFEFTRSGKNKSILLPDHTQLTLVSATMPTSIYDILEEIVDQDSLHKVTTQNLHHVMPHVLQKFIRLGKNQKPDELLKIVKKNMANNIPTIIFSNKSATSDWISLFLNENGIKCVNFNGDMQRIHRIGKFKEFQSKKTDVISCTDIGSRGLDTIRAKHVINYDFPLYMADYIHRCGRTGRIGSSEDCCITNFVEGPLEIDLCQKIEMSVRTMGNELQNVNANISRIIEHRAFMKTFHGVQ